MPWHVSCQLDSAKTTLLLTAELEEPAPAPAAGGRRRRRPRPRNLQTSLTFAATAVAAMQSARVRVTDLPTNAAEIAGPEQHEQRTPLRFGPMRARKHSGRRPAFTFGRRDFFARYFSSRLSDYLSRHCHLNMMSCLSSLTRERIHTRTFNQSTPHRTSQSADRVRRLLPRRLRDARAAAGGPRCRRRAAECGASARDRVAVCARRGGAIVRVLSNASRRHASAARQETWDSNHTCHHCTRVPRLWPLCNQAVEASSLASSLALLTVPFISCVRSHHAAAPFRASSSRRTCSRKSKRSRTHNCSRSRSRIPVHPALLLLDPHRRRRRHLKHRPCLSARKRLRRRRRRS
jgi:hypothetical protein